MTNQNDSSKEMAKAVARLQAKILALVMGLACGFGLFAMTAWLVVKGGNEVGLHLKLLGHYFIGYSVTWPGAFVGLGYGFIVGGAIGWQLDKWFETSPVFLLIFFILGAAAGIWNVIRTALAMQSEAEREPGEK